MFDGQEWMGKTNRKDDKLYKKMIDDSRQASILGHVCYIIRAEKR